jgi:hypothetical protein
VFGAFLVVGSWFRQRQFVKSCLGNRNFKERLANLWRRAHASLLRSGDDSCMVWEAVPFPNEFKLTHYMFSIKVCGSHSCAENAQEWGTLGG